MALRLASSFNFRFLSASCSSRFSFNADLALDKALPKNDSNESDLALFSSTVLRVTDGLGLKGDVNSNVDIWKEECMC